jgi:hypothetical protein
MVFNPNFTYTLHKIYFERNNHFKNNSVFKCWKWESITKF